jgi:excisionase family DNA binding protein
MQGRESTSARLIDAAEVARRLGLSVRTVRVLQATGRMPAPIRIGRRVRWQEVVISAWIAAGCPDCRNWKPASH